jgi:hypothetical protein
MRAIPSFGHRVRNCRAAAAAAFVAAVVTWGSALRANEHPTLLPLSVIVYNYAGLPPATLDRATQAATKLYRRIGVEITWVSAYSLELSRLTAGPEDQLRVMQRAMFLRLLSQAMVDARNAPEEVLGQALRGSRFAAVFTPRVTALADRERTNHGMLLGHVIAHEIGHLLMQPGHSTAA